MKSPAPRIQSVESIEELAKTLGIGVEFLLQVLLCPDKFYNPNKPKVKSDKTLRYTYRVLEPLKSIHESIKNTFFYVVEYPDYLQGGIRDIKNQRGYIQNASKHSKNKILIKEDIADFFPSIRATQVFELWKDFFGFPENIAKLLTDLTTYHGFVPQGAKTSSYIANLIFWKDEPALDSWLESKGLLYTRLVDDITVSTDKRLTKAEKQEITEAIYQMMFDNGFIPKRNKRRVMSSGTRMSIHNLNINSGTPTLSKKERSKIRSAVKECETLARSGTDSEEYEEKFVKVQGRVSVLERLHPSQAKKLNERLDLIKPLNKK